METRYLKVRTDLHLLRKIWHMAGVFVLVYLFARLSRQDALFALAIAGLIVIPFDILRLRRPELNNWVVRVFGPFLRIEEIGALSGMAYMVVGAFISILVFPKPVAMLALILLGVGDPVSSAVGVLYGKDKIWGRKSLQGTVGGFVACTIASACYFLATNTMVERLILVSLLAGLIGALSELVQIKRLDDNLTFPILASSFLYMLFTVFGGF